MTAREVTTVIMGAGNILMQDDGIGVHVVQTLQAQGDLPEDVEIIDAGTAGADCLGAFPGIEKLIVIDAVRGGGEPGTLYLLSPEDVRQTPGSKLSLHQMTLMESLDMARLLGTVPREVVIIGIEPAIVAEGMGLTSNVAAQIPKVIETIQLLLK